MVKAVDGFDSESAGSGGDRGGAFKLPTYGFFTLGSGLSQFPKRWVEIQSGLFLRLVHVHVHLLSVSGMSGCASYPVNESTIRSAEYTIVYFSSVSHVHLLLYLI